MAEDSTDGVRGMVSQFSGSAGIKDKDLSLVFMSTTGLTKEDCGAVVIADV